MANNQTIKICNGRVLTPYRIIENGTIIIENGVITVVSEGPVDIMDALVIDACGRYIAPGFIDIHVHGGGGADFMDGSEEAFCQIAKTHAQYGTTAMSPTTLTAEKENILKILSVYEKMNGRSTGGASFIGMHLEGPYFAINQRGAQDPRYIRDPDPTEYKEILQSPAVRRWSAAPELNGAIEFGQYLAAKGILVSAAHTDAVYEEVIRAFENGYTLATHLYSGMSGVTRRKAFRYAGVIESALLIDEMDVEIIADGVHLPAPLLQLIYKIKGAGRIALITDAMRAAGMPPGESMIGSLTNGIRVIIEDNVAKLPDRSSFAGSIATTDILVRNMVRMANASIIDAVRMMTSTPARIMKLEKKGSLSAGKDADIVLFDNDINVSMTMVGGKIIFDKAFASLQSLTP